MNNMPDTNEKIGSEETASIENTGSKYLSISLICSNGCRVDVELMPGQVLEFTAGSSEAMVILHHGDPANLLIIKPESAS